MQVVFIATAGSPYRRDKFLHGVRTPTTVVFFSASCPQPATSQKWRPVPQRRKHHRRLGEDGLSPLEPSLACGPQCGVWTTLAGGGGGLAVSSWDLQLGPCRDRRTGMHCSMALGLPSAIQWGAPGVRGHDDYMDRPQASGLRPGFPHLNAGPHGRKDQLCTVAKEGVCWVCSKPHTFQRLERFPYMAFPP